MASDSNLTSGRTNSCSLDLPSSSVFFSSISEVEKALIALCALVFIVTVIDYIEQVRYILYRYQTNMAIKYTSIQIQGIYSVVSLTCLVALCIPRANVVSQLASAVYIAMCMFQFVTLMALYFGGPEKLLDHLKEARISLREPPCCCCCLCLPTLPATLKNIFVIKVLVLQNVILQPLLTFTIVVLWIDGEYTDGRFSSDNAFPYLTAVNVFSSLMALYGFMVSFSMCRDHLRAVAIVPKCVILQLVIALCQLQDLVFSTLERFDIPACVGNLSSAYLQMVLVLEMFVLSLLGRCLYRRPHDNLPSSFANQMTVPSRSLYNTDKIKSPAQSNGHQPVLQQPASSKGHQPTRTVSSQL